MAATAPTRTKLAGNTLNRGFYVDVAPATATGPGTYISLMGMKEFKPKFANGATADTSDFDGGGFKDADVVSQEWGSEGKMGRKVVPGATPTYDPGQQFVIAQSAKLGSAAPFYARIYEMEPGGPRVEAIEGLVTATTDYDGGGMDATKDVSFTMTGKGAPTSTTHPFPAA